MTVNVHFEIVQLSGERTSYVARARAYLYELLDAEEREIMVFHWHPEGPSSETAPHLHLGAGAGELRAEFARAHVPTGHIALQQVIRLAIEAFGAKPHRANWRSALARSSDAAGA
jgi:hypothetical protein